MNVERFQIAVPQETLDDLRLRLERTRFPDTIEGSGWEYGTDLATVRDLVRHWLDGFDWRAQEAALNRWRHFRAEVGDVSVHFVHELGRGPAPWPIVITHGWPGSFVEMLRLIPLLADPGAHGGDPADAFDVVVPSLPGYGFSARPRASGMNAFVVADLWSELMGGLGYGRYGVQGGDWGASVATALGLRHASELAGIHLNYVPGSYRPHVGPGARPLSDPERDFLADAEAWYESEGGYAHLQRTRPQTLAFALNDSPAGLAAWIVEKLRDWSDCDGEVERRFSKDEILTNVMLYWSTGTIHASMRLYFEGKKAPIHMKEGESVRVPCAIARFPKEAPFPPREWIERGYQVARWTEMPRGGHFAAWEEPELLAQDVRAFFRPLRDRP